MVQNIEVTQTDSGWQVTANLDELLDDEQKAKVQRAADAAGDLLDALDAFVAALRS